jgi:hypothetical protein
MKFTLFAFLICISVCTPAQPPKTINNDKGFNSCFQKIEKGYFFGYADGLMQFEYNDGTKFLASFSKDSAHLDIVPDPYNVYDVSTKKYIVKNNDIQLEYYTYGGSNALIITKGSNKYTLSLISGACILVINGLDYKYILNGGTELLIIHFSDRIGLYATEGYTSPEFYVLKGSTLIFHIKK